MVSEVLFEDVESAVYDRVVVNLRAQLEERDSLRKRDSYHYGQSTVSHHPDLDDRHLSHQVSFGIVHVLLRPKRGFQSR
jgi:hypothetical protein